jgi:hypothetical protein
LSNALLKDDKAEQVQQQIHHIQQGNSDCCSVFLADKLAKHAISEGNIWQLSPTRFGDED